MAEKPGFAMQRTCAECPWRRDVPTGRFPPERYKDLEATCRPGGVPSIFACHKTEPGTHRACAGFLIVHGHDNNTARVAAMGGAFDPTTITAAAPLYGSFDEMARANGYDPPPTEDQMRRWRRLLLGDFPA